MKEVVLTITSHVQVGKDIFKMRLEGDLTEIKNPGEFINITLPGYYLKRPISVSDYTENYVDIVYKVLGLGTKDMSQYVPGETLKVLVGLGNGFTIKKDINPVLIAGGIGIAPMINLAKEFNKLGIKPTLVYGARSKDDIVLLDELNELCTVYVCTDLGDLGFKGNVLDCIK